MTASHPLPAIAALRAMAAGPGGCVLAVSGDGTTEGFYGGVHRAPARTLLEALLTFVAADYDEIVLFAGRGDHLPSAPIGPLVRLGAGRAAVYLRRSASREEEPPPPAQPASRFHADLGERRRQRAAAGLNRVELDAANMDWKTRVPEMLDRIERWCGVDHVGSPVAPAADGQRRRLVLIDVEFLVPDRARWRQECDVSHSEAGHIPARFARVPRNSAGTRNDVVLLARDPAEVGAVASGEIVRRRLDADASHYEHLTLRWQQVTSLRMPGHPAVDALRAYYPESRPLAYQDFRTVSLTNPKSWRPVPIEAITSDQLVDRMRRTVMGQDASLRRIADAVTTNVANRGLSDSRPIGSFLLAGPTGAGKTETAKALAKALFGEDLRYFHVIRMEQCTGEFELFGVPPGYVGYSDDKRLHGGGRLTAPLIRHPDRPLVILLDELEKGWPRYAEMLFGVLDEGRAEDNSSGHVVSFRNVILIVTTNVAAVQLSALIASGASRAAIEAETPRLLVQHGPQTWSPAFLARFGEGVLPFGRPGREDVPDIVRKIVAELIEGSERHRLGTIADGFVAWATEAYQPDFGVRDLRNKIVKRLQAELADINRTAGVNLLLSVDGDGRIVEESREVRT